MSAGLRRHGHVFGRTLAASVAALALVAAAGCGTEPETNIEQTEDEPKRSEPEEKAEPSPSPTFKVEEEPYVEVALEYYEAMNDAIKTGDAQRLRDLSAESCTACYGTADQIEQVYADGGHIEGGETSPAPGNEIDFVKDGNTAHVTVVYKYEPTVMVTKAGAEPEEHPARFREQEFTLEREGSGWTIVELLSNEHDGS